MGTTGCGKSSLVNLIPRFYDVTEGTVLVDGVDVREYDPKALQEKIAIALQKSELFSVSIGENISWGAPKAGREAIEHAAKVAQADGFICASADRYDTMVAERGMSLSGGVVVLQTLMDTVIRKEEDITQNCKYPILAAVPDMEAPGKGGSNYSYDRDKRHAALQAGKKPSLMGKDMNFAAAEDRKSVV